MVFGAPDPDRWSDESTSKTTRHLDCEAVSANRIDQQWKMWPVLFNGPHSNDDGCGPMSNRSFDFGPRHLFKKECFRHVSLERFGGGLEV